MRTITLEEHFGSPGFLAGPGKEFMERIRTGGPRGAKIYEQLKDIGDKRIADMDAANIDMQVLSQNSPGVEQADAAEQITRGIAGRPHPGVVTFRSVDVRDAEAVEAAVQRIWEEHGPLTGAINNAAGNFISPTEKLSPRGFAAITDTVMKGSYHVTHAVGRRWIEQGLPGTVLSTLVSWVHTGSAFVVPSAMAKSAVLAMTRSLAVEWARHGIRLNAVSPGAIPTEYTSVVLGSGRRVRGDMTDLDAVPAGRAGTVAELANLVIFLLSDACEYLTGQNIVMDGAQMLAGPSTFSPLTALSEADWAEIAAQGKAAAAASRRAPGHQ